MKPTAANPTQHETHKAQIILSKPLFIIVCIYQWLSRLLNGVVVDLWKDFLL
jgi:hypothetical protein